MNENPDSNIHPPGHGTAAAPARASEAIAEPTVPPQHPEDPEWNYGEHRLRLKMLLTNEWLQWGSERRPEFEDAVVAAVVRLFSEETTSAAEIVAPAKPGVAHDPEIMAFARPTFPTVRDVLNDVVAHLQNISGSYEARRNNLPANLKGSHTDNILGEKADATQRVSEHVTDLILDLDEWDADADGDASDNEGEKIGEQRVFPANFLQGSCPTRIGGLIEILTKLARVVEPRNAKIVEPKLRTWLGKWNVFDLCKP